MLNSGKKPLFWGGLTSLLICVFVFGVYLGYQNRPAVQKISGLLNKSAPASLNNVDLDGFWKTWNSIETKYVSSDGLDKQKMVWGAVSGLVNSLEDPYSVFFPPKEAELFESSVRGDFEGVGMEIGMKNNILTVVAPLKDTPAWRAGIKTGDQILKIDQTLTADLTVDKAVQLIRGEKGTKVKLTISREEAKEPFEVEITRDVIQIPAIETEKKDNGIFIIHLYNFSGNSSNAFKEALREMINSDSSKLILDLRGNPGGYLETATDIASWFLPLGDIVAREKFSNGDEQLYRSKGYNIFNNLKMVILVNGGSASASEILAGALSEHEVATLVGEKTFGKGSVQELISMTDNSSLKLTIARWLTPNGKSISESGLDPDVEVKLTVEDFEANRDPQMDKAVEILTKGQ